MRKKSIVSENLAASGPRLQNIGWIRNQLKLCWKCQKDKPREGGEVKLTGSKTTVGKFFSKHDVFICADCVAERQAKKEQQDEKPV